MDSQKNNPNQYLKAKVLTASPEELQLMLYDGAIRFCEQARPALEEKRIEESFNALTRAQKIVMEMCTALRDDVDPDTCNNMRALYLFCYDRLITANVDKDIKPLDETLQILRHMRETWLLLMEKIKNDAAQQHVQTTAPQDLDQLEVAEVGATVNFEG